MVTGVPGLLLPLVRLVRGDFYRAAHYLACASLAATLQPLLERP